MNPVPETYSQGNRADSDDYSCWPLGIGLYVEAAGISKRFRLYLSISQKLNTVEYMR